MHKPDFAIGKSMTNNVGTFRCASDNLPSMDCWSTVFGTLRPVSNIAIQTLMANNAGTFRRASDKLPSTGCCSTIFGIS